MSSTNHKSEVKVIDFGKFLSGSTEDKQAAARELDECFQRDGFVYLKNHSVPLQQVDKCFEWSKRFFSLPTETKLLCPHPPGGSHHRGYSKPSLEKVSQHAYSSDAIAAARSVPDYKESFESGKVDDPYQPNIWPPADALPGFQDFMQDFYLECAKLVHNVLECLALALNVDPVWFSGTHSQDLFQLRLLHYPSVPLAALQDQIKTRIGAHSDFGTVTLLFQDAVGGLEFESPGAPGRFVDAQPVEGACMVNFGDLMERWSNGRWKSAVHRVGPPPPDRTSTANGNETGEVLCKPRYSIPFFSITNLDTVIDALPGCWSEENPKKFETVTAGEYVQKRMAALYDS